MFRLVAKNLFDQLFLRDQSFSSRIISGLVLVFDGLAIWGSGMLIYALYLPSGPEDFWVYLSVTTVNTLFLLLLFFVANLYQLGPIALPAQQIKKIVSILTMVFLGLVAFLFALKISSQFSRVWIFSWYFLSLLLLYMERTGANLFLRKSAERGRLTRNTVVFGAGNQGAEFVNAIQNDKYPWIRIIGFFDDRHDRVPSEVSGYPVLGDLEKLIQYIRRNRCDEIIVTLPWGAADRISDIVQQFKVLPINIALAPDLVALKYAGAGYENYAGVPVLKVVDKPISEWNYVSKFIIDQVLGLLLALALLPVCLLIALLIKLDSSGPVLFRQQRYGFNNKLINIYKFRTLRNDQKDKDAEKLVYRNDPRVTRLGAFLRRTSLDELPQLINVLKGEMSLVGPRPHALKASAEGKLYEDAVYEYAARHKVKPGITGWAQVKGWRGETDTQEKITKRVEYDMYYINNWSLSFDISIIFRTFLILFHKDNVY